ncbi:MAG: copper amine oxidase N-terminal domain-containing protein [Candidatus Xenobia bacterium]
MKRALLLCMLLLLALPAWSVGPEVEVDGSRLMLDRPVLQERGHVLVPVRGIFEALHAEVSWNPAIDTMTARRGDDVITLRTDEYVATVNWHIIALEVPGRIVQVHVDHRWEPTLYVPLRFVAQALGATVTWHPGQVEILSNYKVPEAAYHGPHQVLEAPATIPVEDSRLIAVVTLNPKAALEPGQPLVVSMDGVPGARASFDYGKNEHVPMTEEKPGHYTGSAMLTPEDVGSGQFLVVHLVTPDGHEDSRYFPLPVPVIQRLGDEPPIIASVSDNGPGPLFAGEHFLMGARGTAGAQAWFTLLGVNYLMPEVSPGYYRADYIVRAHEIANNEPITVTLLSKSGASSTVMAPQKVTLVGR